MRRATDARGRLGVAGARFAAGSAALVAERRGGRVFPDEGSSGGAPPTGLPVFQAAISAGQDVPPAARQAAGAASLPDEEHQEKQYDRYDDQSTNDGLHDQ